MGWSCDLSAICCTANLHCVPGRASSYLRPPLSASAIFHSSDTLSLSSPFSPPTFSRSTFVPAARLGSVCSSFRDAKHLPKASEYVFPDPIPEFAEAVGFSLSPSLYKPKALSLKVKTQIRTQIPLLKVNA